MKAHPQISKFFPDGAITEDSVRAALLNGFDVERTAPFVLEDDAYATFEADYQQAVSVYLRAIAPARAAYTAAVRPFYTPYQAESMVALDDLLREPGCHLIRCDETTVLSPVATAFFEAQAIAREACDAAEKPAGAVFDAAVATAFAKAWRINQCDQVA